jgi:hypothetical protein
MPPPLECETMGRELMEADGPGVALRDLLPVPAMLNIRSWSSRPDESLSTRSARAMSSGRPWPSSSISPNWPPPACAGVRRQCERPGRLRPVADAAVAEPERERQPALPVRVRRPGPAGRGRLPPSGPGRPRSAVPDRHLAAALEIVAPLSFAPNCTRELASQPSAGRRSYLTGSRRCVCFAAGSEVGGSSSAGQAVAGSP